MTSNNPIFDLEIDERLLESLRREAASLLDKWYRTPREWGDAPVTNARYNRAFGRLWKAAHMHAKSERLTKLANLYEDGGLLGNEAVLLDKAVRKAVDDYVEKKHIAPNLDELLGRFGLSRDVFIELCAFWRELYTDPYFSNLDWVYLETLHLARKDDSYAPMPDWLRKLIGDVVKPRSRGRMLVVNAGDGRFVTWLQFHCSIDALEPRKQFHKLLSLNGVGFRETSLEQFDTSMLYDHVVFFGIGHLDQFSGTMKAFSRCKPEGSFAALLSVADVRDLGLSLEEQRWMEDNRIQTKEVSFSVFGKEFRRTLLFRSAGDQEGAS